MCEITAYSYTNMHNIETKTIRIIIRFLKTKVLWIWIFVVIGGSLGVLDQRIQRNLNLVVRSKEKWNNYQSYLSDRAATIPFANQTIQTANTCVHCKEEVFKHTNEYNTTIASARVVSKRKELLNKGISKVAPALGGITHNSTSKSIFPLLNTSKSNSVVREGKTTKQSYTKKQSTRQEVTQEFVKKMENTMQLRKEHLQRACHQLGINPANKTFEVWEPEIPSPKPWFFISHEYKFIFSAIPKAGSTNWKRILLVLNGSYNKTGEISQTAAHSAPLDIVGKFRVTSRHKTLYRNATKLMVVRDPMERIVSAYVDKVTRKSLKGPTFSKFSYEVAKKYGNRWKDKTIVHNDAVREITTCEGLTAELCCLEHDHVIKVVDAVFGRFDNKTCGIDPKWTVHKACSSIHSYFVTSQLCNGRKKCDIIATQKLFNITTSCPPLKKALKISYACKSSKTVKKLTDPAIYQPVGQDQGYKIYKLSATFREFVLYLIDPNNTVFLNDVIDHGSALQKWSNVRHWMPFYELSYPCHVDYDVIAHMETIDDDARYLLHLINAPPDLHYPRGYNQQSGGSTTTSALLRDLFATLSNDEKQKLVDRYSLDYKLFGYKMPSFHLLKNPNP